MAGAGTAYPADYSATYSGPQYAATQGRTALAAAMGGVTAARPLGGLSGVRPGTPGAFVTVSSTTWTVTPFGGYIDLEASASNGGYFFSFQGNSGGTITAAAGSARVDLLYVQIADTNAGDGTTVAPRVILDYQAGVAGAGIPTLTAPRAFVIAQINVPASGGGSPTSTWVAPYTVAAGGVLPIPTAALLFSFGAGYAGMLAYVTNDGANTGLWHCLTTGWVRVPRSVGGYFTGTTDVNGNVSITHGLGVTPTSMQVTGGTNGTIPERRTYAITGTPNSTVFAVKTYRQDTGVPFASNVVDFFWEAFS